MNKCRTKQTKQNNVIIIVVVVVVVVIVVIGKQIQRNKIINQETKLKRNETLRNIMEWK